jgi:hypothetical protein
MNNPRVSSMLSTRFSEHFGFTQVEVDALLHYYLLDSRREDVKNWYDGYHLLPDVEVYNPWSMLGFIDNARGDTNTLCMPYWANTSSNDIVKRLVTHAGPQERADLEALMAGGDIEKPVSENVTYARLEDDPSAIWSFLFFTGYLTLSGQRLVGDIAMCSLRIPNVEVKTIFTQDIQTWFAQRVKARDMGKLSKALFGKDAAALTDEITDVLFETISYHDYDEKFYHGFMAGLFAALPGYTVQSNREEGLGRPDVCLLPANRKDPYVILEFKNAPDMASLDRECAAAVKQIADRRYADAPLAQGYRTVLCCGVAFWKKTALVQFAA